tara:strand:+ start:2294 stop:2914 length:621 start_codon:yes stop_codon:yes gene_type:complete
MSRDYKSSKPSTSTKSKGSLIWGLFIGYALGLISAIGVWMYLSQAPSPFLTKENVADNTPIKYGTSNTQETLTLATDKEKPTQVDEKTRFDFYKILPGVEEPVTEQEFKQAVQQPPISINHTAPIENYFLQAGSFRKNNDAENLKARLALLGMVASVQSADLAEKGIWHRVRLGPFTKIVDVDQVRISLQQNGIETHFIKVRKNVQ